MYILLIYHNNNLCFFIEKFRNSINWHPLAAAAENTISNIGSIKEDSERFCLTPGLTVGIKAGALMSKLNVDLGSHHKILERAMNGEFECGIISKDCVQLLNELKVDPIRARTMTSAGMRGIDSDTIIVKHHQEEFVNHYVKAFNLDLSLLHHTNSYFTNQTNLVDIANDNLR